jgi:hypothetical protein
MTKVQIELSDATASAAREAITCLRYRRMMASQLVVKIIRKSQIFTTSRDGVPPQTLILDLKPRQQMRHRYSVGRVG